jgi:preprotein translocase subunit SecF
MFIGALVSTYSSIFVASPILAWLKEREPRYRQIRARIQSGVRAEPVTAAARASMAASTPSPASTPEPFADKPRTQVRTASRPPPRARRGRGGKRRRR